MRVRNANSISRQRAIVRRRGPRRLELTDLETLGIYAVEWMVGHDVGLRYRRWLDCD